ncbi:Panacea domain-containing protein [Methylobacterium sp. 22177]|uniref:Panacea domain-containing protein n=1 Tax=Methylobacterium sp. 22177 TaxID=3453885 RepID=UPI003F857B57
MQKSPPYDARAIANFLLDLADSRGVQLTQMSVLKIVYFAHGWYLAINERPLCAQEFEAWTHGPVVKVVRDAFKNFRKEFITSRATKLILTTGEIVEVEPDLSSEDKKFIEGIFDAYHIYDAWQLSDFTHETGSPWDVLWNSPEPVGRLALRIKNEEIRAHFRSLRQRFALS